MRDIDLSVYFIMGSMNTANRNPLEVLEQALLGGITCFQLREKGPGALKGNEKITFAKNCQQLCNSFNVPFIVNDDVDLALTIHADGVHLGQDDLFTTTIRDVIGDRMILGISVHSLQEAEIAHKMGANYVGMGPVYHTSSKSDAKPVAGTLGITEVITSLPELPIVGIGGITVHTVHEVLTSGAAGISTISAIAQATNPRAASQALVDAARQVRCRME